MKDPVPSQLSLKIFQLGMLWALSRIYVLSFSLLSTYFAEQAPSQDHKSEYIKIDTKNRLN